MTARLIKNAFLTFIAFALVFAAMPAAACTGIQVKTGDGAVIRARTMEFAPETQSDILFFPRGQAFSADLKKGQKGMSWKNKYAFMGLNLMKMKHVVDGINETGLYATGLFFPDFAGYQKYEPKQAGKTISQLNLCDWILGNFSNVQEVKKAIRNTRVVGAVLAAMGPDFVIPAHWLVTDKSGACMVIEYVGGKLHLYDNPIGVFTNSPTFDWHMINLRNYMNLTANNVPALNMKDLKLMAIGQGTGMLGLPGDYTPPSRFVRAAALSMSAKQVDTADQGVILAWHIINNIDITIGAAREAGPDGKTGYDYTQWVSVWDLANLKVYFRTYYDLNIRSVSLKKLGLDGKKMLTIPVWKVRSGFKDVSNTAR
jgi:choloylglycine hydrolase